MDECINSFAIVKVFQKLDCKSGYGQMLIKATDRRKTSFSSHHGLYQLYQFPRMPFGLGNAPASFQRAIDITLLALRFKSVMVYLDDVIVFSRNVEGHLYNL